MIPLIPSTSKTIYRSQGSSYGDVVVDLTPGWVRHHEVYVAISRVTNSKGLAMVGFSKDLIKIKKDVSDEMARLRPVDITLVLYSTFHNAITRKLDV
ncbi:MAG: hypothetical protein GY820_27995 [Gammaproteobacteria bacterium]|nr:hypothetical protein [Gammaproteobacteria bacterium]